MDRIPDGFKNEKAIVLPYNVREYLLKNEITKGLHITHIGYYPKAKYHFREREGGTNQNILIYCESGKGWIVLNGEKVHIQRNQVFIIPEGQSHSYGADTSDPWNIYWIHFEGENAEQFSAIFGRKIDISYSHCSRIEDRLSLFEEMFCNLEMGYSPENLEYVSYCITYFLSSIKYITQFRKVRNIGEKDTIQKSILFMKDNLDKSLSLEDIAVHIGYSPSHFGNLFLKNTSYTPIAYYNQLKIQRACSLLQFSGLKVKEIAYRLGFYDPFHFSKSFKREMKMTPREYRSRYNP